MLPARGPTDLPHSVRLVVPPLMVTSPAPFLRLQVAQTVRKIAQIDDHICLAFAGLTADARVLINKARIEAQSHRLTLDERSSVDHMVKYIAGAVGGKAK